MKSVCGVGGLLGLEVFTINYFHMNSSVHQES